VRPTEAQRASLVTLEDDTTKAADMLKASCQPDNSLTPPARLATVGKRLDTMLQAVKTVRTGLDGFHGSLNDEQKARFEAIGPQRTSEPDQPKARQVHYQGRSIEGGVDCFRQSTHFAWSLAHSFFAASHCFLVQVFTRVAAEGFDGLL
jgi:hypothetical protein